MKKLIRTYKKDYMNQKYNEWSYLLLDNLLIYASCDLTKDIKDVSLFIDTSRTARDNPQYSKFIRNLHTQIKTEGEKRSWKNKVILFHCLEII